MHLIYSTYAKYILHYMHGVIIFFNFLKELPVFPYEHFDLERCTLDHERLYCVLVIIFVRINFLNINNVVSQWPSWWRATLLR
jgi:hypothetical protein